MPREMGGDAGATTTTGKEGAERVMADDRIDWADVAAVGVIHLRYPLASVRLRVSELLGAPAHYCSDIEREHTAIASALREAHEAGREESRTRVEVAQEVASYLVSILPLTPAAIEIMSKELARLQDENRALRREVAALALVMAWLDEDNRHVDCYGGEWSVWEDEPMPDGTGWIEGGPAKAAGRTMTALAAALGLEVEDE